MFNLKLAWNVTTQEWFSHKENLKFELFQYFYILPVIILPILLQCVKMFNSLEKDISNKKVQLFPRWC